MVGILTHLFDWHAAWILPLLIVAGAVGILGFQAVKFLRMDQCARSRRLRILETNFGRDAGWFVEIDGRRVAALKSPQWYDMFWDSYEIEPLTEDAGERRRILTDIQWWDSDVLVYRSRDFDDIAENAFAGGDFVEEARLVFRGLYLVTEDPNGWESLVMYWRRKSSLARESEPGERPA